MSNTANRVTTPMKGYHRSRHPVVICQCLGAKVHQRRSSQVQCQPHHPQVRHQDCRKDQGGNRSE